MNTLFKAFLFLCLLSSFAFSKEVNFIHITDINLNTKNAYQLQKTIKEINSLSNIDFVLFGGNNISKTNIDNLNTFLYLLRRVHKKSVVLIGSTDVLSTTGIDKEYYLKRVNRALFFRHSLKPNYVFSKKGYIFVVMDGSKQYFQSSNGCYTKEELRWLDETLKRYKNKDVIILQHFPILENSSKWLETAKIEDYEEVLKKHKNVKAIVSGHYGHNLQVKKDEIYHLITQSYSKQMTYKIIKMDLKEDFIATYIINN